jgi:hypothetical protein
MHNRVTFPDFSAFQMTIAALPSSQRPAAGAADGGTAAVTRPATFQSAPPFSWLGGDAWPNVPALADTPP